MVTLTITSLSIIAFYFIYCFITIGVKQLPSLSSSYYYTKWLFQISLFITSASLVPVILEITPEIFQIFAFLSTSPLMFVALSPNFKNKDLESKVHTYSAIIAATSSFIWSMLILNIYIFVPIVLALILSLFILIKRFKQPIFFSELIIFILVYFTLIYTYLIN